MSGLGFKRRPGGWDGQNDPEKEVLEGCGNKSSDQGNVISVTEARQNTRERLCVTRDPFIDTDDTFVQNKQFKEKLLGLRKGEID